MENTLFEREVRSDWRLSDEENTNVRQTLLAHGIVLSDDLENDPFYVALCAFHMDNTGACFHYIDFLSEPYIKAIHQNLQQADGITYAVTFELHNGYDVSFGLDTGDNEKIFLHGGKDVMDSPAFVKLFEFDSYDDLLFTISEMPSNVHLQTDFEVFMGKDYDQAMDWYETDSKEEVDEIVKKEYEELLRRYV